MWNGARVGIRLYHLLAYYLYWHHWESIIRIRTRYALSLSLLAVHYQELRIQCVLCCVQYMYSKHSIHMHGLVFNDELQQMMLMLLLTQRMKRKRIGNNKNTATTEEEKNSFPLPFPFSILSSRVESYEVFDTFQLHLMVTDKFSYYSALWQCVRKLCFDQDMMRTVATMNWTRISGDENIFETISMENSDLVLYTVALTTCIHISIEFVVLEIVERINENLKNSKSILLHIWTN